MRPTPLQSRAQRRSASAESLITGPSSEPRTRHDRIRAYEWPSAPDRAQHREAIAELDARSDYREVLRISAFLDLPWEFTSGLTLALGRADLPQGVLSPADILGLIRDGLDAPSSVAVLQRLTAYREVDDDHAETLTALLIAAAVGPVEFAADYGWRYVTDAETIATAAFYRAIAQRLDVALPRAYGAFEQAARERWDTDHPAIHPAAHETFIRGSLDDLTGQLPDRLKQPARRTGELLAPPAAAAAALLAKTPLAPGLRATYREIALTRRSLLLLRAGRSSTKPLDP